MKDRMDRNRRGAVDLPPRDPATKDARGKRRNGSRRRNVAEMLDELRRNEEAQVGGHAAEAEVSWFEANCCFNPRK